MEKVCKRCVNGVETPMRRSGTVPGQAGDLLQNDAGHRDQAGLAHRVPSVLGTWRTSGSPR